MKRKGFIPVFALACILLFPITAYAGDINGAEQSIISAISAVYAYDGAYYKVTDGYIGQVTAYLSQDGVDMTSEQASGYLAQFYANIGTGISSGYMTKVGGGDPAPAETTTPTEEETETAAEAETTTEMTPETEIEIIDPKEKLKELTGETLEESETQEGIVDNTIGSTQSGKLEYTVAPMEGYMYVWDADTLEVHSEAYKDSDIIGTLEKGERVKITGAATTGWAEIDYNGEKGYVSSVYLRTAAYMTSIGEEIIIEEETTTEEETMTQTESAAQEETTQEETKDYSNASPYKKSLKLEIVAVVIVVLFVIASAIAVLYHKNKNRR